MDLPSWRERRKQWRLPVQDPVFWLELHRRSLASTRYLLRLFLPIAGALVLLALLWRSEGVMVLIEEFGLPITVLLVCLLNSGALSQERADQTLDTVLTAGLTPQDIIRQKMRALSRIRWAASLTLLLALLAGLLGTSIEHGYYITPSAQMLTVAGLVAWQLVMVPAIAGWVAMRCPACAPPARVAPRWRRSGWIGGWLVGSCLLVQMLDAGVRGTGEQVLLWSLSPLHVLLLPMGEGTGYGDWFRTSSPLHYLLLPALELGVYLYLRYRTLARSATLMVRARQQPA